MVPRLGRKPDPVTEWKRREQVLALVAFSNANAVLSLTETKKDAQKRTRRRFCYCCGVSFVCILIPFVVMLSLGILGLRGRWTGSSGRPSSASTYPANHQPVAKCLAGVLKFRMGPFCEPISILPKTIDNGSSDPDEGDNENGLAMSMDPPGPFFVGIHNVTLTVQDRRGGWDSCQAVVAVLEHEKWHMFQSHGYRVTHCRQDWEGAKRSTAETTLCGRYKAHLVTITSPEEHDFVANKLLLPKAQSVWMGGFLPQSSTRDTEHHQDWTWIDGEGLISDGFTRWRQGEPHRSEGEDDQDDSPRQCLALLDGEWKASACSNSRASVMEADIDSTVVVNGCDTGVQDVFDPVTCEFVIQSSIDTCHQQEQRSSSSPNSTSFGACVEFVLAEWFDDGILSANDFDAVLACISSGNLPPVARCRQDLVVPAHPHTCLLKSLEASALDDGSLDRDGDPLQFSVSPQGPYPVGMHAVTLRVEDDKGYFDTCVASILVVEDAEKAGPWRSFNNHAYRLSSCRGYWPAADAIASATSLCGTRGHLATITSPEENAFVNGLVYSEEEFWIGGFQPKGAREADEGWVWVNGEGFLADGYANWDRPHQPNNNSGRESCLSIIASTGFWNDDRCSRVMRQYVMEVELVETNVVINGCDTGVRDILDLETCDYTITRGIADCRNKDIATDFEACLEEFLVDLVLAGVVTQEESDKIRTCGFQNAPPIARCVPQLEVQARLDCELESIIASDLDDESSDPEGDELQFSVSPEGPYAVGSNTLTLLVEDGRGGSDSCESSLLVLEPFPTLFFWRVFENHAYRVSNCFADWPSAKLVAEASTLCGLEGHLATITSQRENDFLESLKKEFIWIGGSQPPGSIEPDGNWTWVNGEGLISDGDFINWSDGEPNNSGPRGREDCILFRNGKWNDASCFLRPRPFAVEVELLETTVMVDGCDSGVADFFDIDSCNSAISSGISACGTSQGSPNFWACVEGFLDGLLDDGILSLGERNMIRYCGAPNEPPVARCRQDLVLSAGPSCTLGSVQASDLDGGSFDPNSDSLDFVVAPSPYRVGLHLITLTVLDGRGGVDSCNATVLILEDESRASPWQQFQNHAYRESSCASDWQGATAVATNTSLCGVQAHLVTITSQEENDFVSTVSQRRVWIGAFQPPGSKEPDGGWTWVNDEGLLPSSLSNQGFAAWFGEEPNNSGARGSENCAFIKDGKWNDADCSGRPWPSIIEVDFVANTVVVAGCYSGVADFLDLDTCEYVIASGIASCGEPQANEAGFQNCVQEFLVGLVDDGSLDSDDQARILRCLKIGNGHLRRLGAEAAL